MSKDALRDVDPARIVDYILPVLLPLLPSFQPQASGAAGGGGGGALTAHALSSIYHSGTLADAQAPQFLKVDGSRQLTGNLAVASGVTIDGVDISAHVALPDAHHARQHSIISGSDHTVTGSIFDLVGVVAATTLGMITPTHNPGAAPRILKTDAAGNLILTTLQTTGLMTASSGVNYGANTIVEDATYLRMTGSKPILFITGLTASGWTLTPAGVLTAASATFTGNVQGASIIATTRLRGPLLDTASGDLTINPAARTLFADNKDIRSQSHTPGFGGQGFAITWPNTGDARLDIRSIYAERLEVTAFQADVMRLRIAEDFLGQSMGTVAQDFVTPTSLGGTVRVYFENSPAIAGDLFINNEWIMFQVIDRSGGGLTVAQIWGQVSSRINETGNRQSWQFVLRSGQTSFTVPQGSIAIDFGLSGDGYIHANVLRSAYGPWTRYATWSGANPYTPANRIYHVQVGNLRGLVDYTANRYGIAIGDDLSKTPTTGFSGLTADNVNGLRMFNTDIYLRAGAQTKLQLSKTSGLNILAYSGLTYDDTAREVIWWDSVDSPTVKAARILGGYNPAYTQQVAVFACDTWVSGYTNIMRLIAGAGAADIENPRPVSFIEMIAPPASASTMNVFANSVRIASTVAFQYSPNGVTWYDIWNAYNDGPGSGLDADTLDTYQASAFGRLAAANTWTANQTIEKSAPALYLQNSDAANTTNLVSFEMDADTDVQRRALFRIQSNFTTIADASRVSRVNFQTASAGTFASTMTLWGGNVGIGNPSPAYTLDITGNVRVTSGQVYSNNNIALLTTSGAAQSLKTGNLLVSNDYNDFSYISANGAYIKGAVNIGMGAAITSGYMLETNGAAYLHDNSRIDGGWYFAGLSSAPGAFTGYAVLYFDNASQTMRVKLPGGTVKTLTWT